MSIRKMLAFGVAIAVAAFALDLIIWSTWAEAPPSVPKSGPRIPNLVPPSVPDLPPVGDPAGPERMSVEQLLSRVRQIRAEKTALEKEEKQIIQLLEKRLGDQKKQLEALSQEISRLKESATGLPLGLP